MADTGISDGPNLPRVGTSRNALTIEVYENLLNALMDGRLAPGDRLVMDRLADDLGVSRSPVRDALQRLHREGVIEPTGRRGYIVREASELDIQNFYTARIAVEGFSVDLLANSGPDVIRRLRQLLDELSNPAPKSVREFFEANRLFHRGVVEATGNAYLTDMFDSIWNRSRTALTYKDFSAADPDNEFLSEHVELLHALDGASPTAARRAVVAHIRGGLERTVGSESGPAKPHQRV
jgi:DNA-binding GntR family transcriptional regulator